MKTICFTARLSIICLTLILFASVVPGQTVSKYTNHFSRFDVVHISKPLQNLSENGQLELTAAGRRYTLRIQPHELRAPHYRAEDTGPAGTRQISSTPITTFKGKIVGDPTSEVRLTIDGNRIEGFFDTSEERFFIEPAIRYSSDAKNNELIVYRPQDVLHQEDLWCDSEMPERIESGKHMAVSNMPKSTAPVATLKRLDLATDADLEFVNIHGSSGATNSEILSILNMVEGVYASELNIRIRVVYQHTWTTTDPFSAPTSEAILGAFRTYWNANFSSVSRNVAHLYSAKDPILSRGNGFLGVVCSFPSYAYGANGYVGWAPGKYLVAAHELGHNLGANHVDATQGCANSVMNAQVSASTPLTFCGFSRNEVSGFVSSNGSCMSTITETQFDFDGDGRADIGVFRPSNGVWYLNQSTAGFAAFQFGQQGDKSVAADYDGDGKSDAAIFRNGAWWRIKSSTSTYDVVSFGLPGDIPAPADFDGDGKTDVVVYRPSTGIWYRLHSSDGSFAATGFGLPEDIPSATDYDGDSKADITVYRPSSGVWYWLNSSDGSFHAIQFGLAGDVPVKVNFDNDAKADIAVWRPSNGVWYWLRSSDGRFNGIAFGMAGDIPTPADFDGDGRTDIAVYRPSSGVWYWLNSSDGSFHAIQFGLAGDVPVQSYNNL